MLIELFGKNFGCFRDEFRLSMLATDIDKDSNRGVVHVRVNDDPEPLALLRCAAIFGPNASGKSTVLLAAQALGYLLGSSATWGSDQVIPYYFPYALDHSTSGSPVSLGVRAVLNGRVLEYAFDFDRTQVLRERLIECNQETDRFLFNRDAGAVQGEWEKHPQFEILTLAFRPNVLLLSLADAVVPDLSQNIAQGFRQLLRQFFASSAPPWQTLGSDVADRIVVEPAFGDWLRPLLTSIDVGVTDFRINERAPVDRPAQAGSSTRPAPGPRKSFELSLMHTGPSGQVPLHYWSESHGTRRFLEFAPAMFDLTHSPAIHALFVDELDSAMHPVLVRGLVQHFNCEVAPNDVRGQIIFTGHNVDLMEGEAKSAVLRRDQVYFTEKDHTGAARLYSLAEFKERNNLNIRRRYLQGRYGAIPSLGEFSE